MILLLKEWVIKIATMIIFITAIEMILPNNNLKKYSKFILGLILISILINPIVKIFDKNFNIDEYTNSAANFFNEEEYKNNFSEYKEKSITSTIKNFKANLQNLCEDKLKQKYPDNTYRVSVDAALDEKADKFKITSISIGITKGTVKKVKKVEITTKGNYQESNKYLNDAVSNSLREFLSKEIDVPKESIYVYEL